MGFYPAIAVALIYAHAAEDAEHRLGGAALPLSA